MCWLLRFLQVVILTLLYVQDWKNQESMLQISTYFLAFISITFNIYIFCHIGEMLVEQCQKIGAKCYTIEWYRLPHNKARSLIFSIIMSNYPVELTAGKIITMTMSSFSNVSIPISVIFTIQRIADRTLRLKLIIRRLYSGCE